MGIEKAKCWVKEENWRNCRNGIEKLEILFKKEEKLKGKSRMEEICARRFPKMTKNIAKLM